MTDEVGSLNASKSESERTTKPLVVSCDYNNTKHQKLTFFSARECSCDELRAKVRVFLPRRTFCTLQTFLRSRKASSSRRVRSRCGGMTMMESRTSLRTKRHWTKRSSTTSPQMTFLSLSSLKSPPNMVRAVVQVVLGCQWLEEKQTWRTDTKTLLLMQIYLSPAL